ncbi:uncharacterized protein E0L32_005776 [Thyridium curvatum]|uniref:Azaphilone pigments biosynthesis cluster protein L N-terminal domain-containing protein n=1 Tax=Thyridium curvatum TaxID=1093900 RepID=A0A507AV41_9PEZI|nr:uncharacterized protein E0L32_005776 [Thyridium curvatum]TPX13832.1 hypothetical protein E0L32_005776 [Thyridium curvatum]
MDPLSIASAAVSFAGFAGQALKGTQALCSFISDIRDAPSKIQRLGDELNTLRKSIEDIRTGHTTSTSIHPALNDAAQLCDDVIGPLHARIERYSGSLASGRIKRRWAQVESAFRGSKIDKMTADVQRARMALVDARLMQTRLDLAEMLRVQRSHYALTSSVQASVNSHIRPQLDRVSQSVAKTHWDSQLYYQRIEEVSDATLATSRDLRAHVGHVATDLQHEIASVKGQIADVHQDMRDLQTAQVANHTILDNYYHEAKATHERMEFMTNKFAQLSVDMEEVKSCVTQLLQPERTPSNMVEAMFEKAVSRSVANALAGLARQTPSASDLMTAAEHAPEASSCTRQKLLYAYNKNYWFGYLSVMAIRTATLDGQSGAISFSIHTSVVFTPHSWIARWTSRLEAVRLMVANRGNLFSLTTSKILAKEMSATISKAVLCGTFDEFRELIQRHNVRPNDLIPVESDTRSVLEMCVEWILIVATFGDDIDLIEKHYPLAGHPRYDDSERRHGFYFAEALVSPNNETSEMTSVLVDKIVRMCGWLLQSEFCPRIAWQPYLMGTLGSEIEIVMGTGGSTRREQNPMNTFYAQISAVSSHSMSENMKFSGPEVLAAMVGLVELVLAQTDQEWQFLDILLLLHAMWNSSAYCSLHPAFSSAAAGDFLDFDSQDTMDTIGRLVAGAAAARVWAAGDASVTLLAAEVIFATIRNVMALSSPLSRDVKIGDTWYAHDLIMPMSQIFWMGAPRKRYHNIMSSIIAKLLQLDANILCMSTNNTTLTESAIQWQVLDLWIEALLLAGQRPDLLLSRSEKSLLDTDYNPLRYMSTSDGASLAFTADGQSGRVCLALDEIQNALSKFVFLRRHPAMGKKIPKLDNFKKDIIAEATRGWHVISPLNECRRGVHCQVKTSPAKFICHPHGDYAEAVLEGSFEEDELPPERYEVRPIGDGGMELIIEIDDIDAPWERLCQEIKDKGQFWDGKGNVVLDIRDLEKYERSNSAGVDAKESAHEASQEEGQEVDRLQNAATAAGWV